MRRAWRTVGAAGLLAASGAAAGKPVVESFGAARIDFSSRTIEIEGAGAADLHAPNAQVARVRAERTARTVAARRLHAALAAMPMERIGCGAAPPAAERVEEAAQAAGTKAIDWASDGSVRLTLRVPFAALVAAPAGDAGAEPPGAIVVDAKAHPRLLAPRAGGCEAAPRFFDTLAEARAAGGELAAAPVTVAHHRPPAEHAAAAPPESRVAAIVRSDDKGGK